MKLKSLVVCLALLASTFAFGADDSASKLESKAEMDLIASAGKKISREKDQLTLIFKNKKKKSFKDSLVEGSEKYIRHVLVDYIAKHEVAVIQQHFYEGGQFLVISLKGGSEIVTPTRPTWSPDKTNFISLNDDESDYTENRTVIGTCKKMKCTKLFTEEAHAGDEKWVDDQAVEYEKRKFDANTGNSEVSNYVCKIEKKVVCAVKK